MLAALGPFVFEAASFPFAELSRRTDWRHGKADRFGARAAAQFLGPGEDRLQLPGCLMPEVAGSFAAIDTLRAMADAGEAYPFVDGTGRVWGEYVIVGMDETRRHMLVDGTPRAVDFTLDLDRVA